MTKKWYDKTVWTIIIIQVRDCQGLDYGYRTDQGQGLNDI